MTTRRINGWDLHWLLRLLVGVALAFAVNCPAEEPKGVDHKIQPGEEIFYKQIGVDKLETRILVEGRVAVDADGEVDLPNVGRILVQGKTIRAIKADCVKKMDQLGKGYYYHIALVPRVESDARIVEVSGGVAFPMKLHWFPGMTLSDAVELCGGLTPDANARKIQITTRSVVTVENLNAPNTKGPELEAGDKIYAPVVLW